MERGEKGRRIQPGQANGALKQATFVLSQKGLQLPTEAFFHMGHF